MGLYKYLCAIFYIRSSWFMYPDGCLLLLGGKSSMKSKALSDIKRVAGGSTSGSGLDLKLEPDSPVAVGLRLSEVRGRRTREEFAPELDVHSNTLARYERGERLPETDFVITLATKRGINPSWLLFGLQPKHLSETTSQEQPEYAKVDLTKMTADEVLSQFVLVPLYDVRASAGFGALVQDKEPIEYWAFRRDWLQREVRVPENRLALIYVAGNSMEPDLHDGDPALVDRGDTELLREGVYVFSLDGHVFVKQISLEGTKLVIQSSNKDHPTLELNTLRDDVSFRIAARVIGSPCFNRL
jgi:phage repressor protein C with HTH and peptisase S24 domain